MYYKITIKAPNGTYLTRTALGKVEHVTSDFMKMSFDTPLILDSYDELLVEYIHEGNPGHAHNENGHPCDCDPPCPV